jgi:ABC-2 type transport system permease protein
MCRAMLTVFTLWWREITRFRRQRSRLFGALGQPLLFWLLLGSGFRASFRPPGMPAGVNYMEYFYPGILALVMLFTAIFATISVVEDRREGFLQGVLVAPVSRVSIVLGQALGGTTLALIQGVLLLLLAPFVGIPLSVWTVVAVIVVLFCLGFSLTNLGLIIAWRMQSTQGFHAIMNVILIPIWLLSGAFFPATGVPVWLAWIMLLNPLTYGMAALRRCLYLTQTAVAGNLPSLALTLSVTVLFGALSTVVAIYTASRSTL